MNKKKGLKHQLRRIVQTKLHSFGSGRFQIRFKLNIFSSLGLNSSDFEGAFAKIKITNFDVTEVKIFTFFFISNKL